VVIGSAIVSALEQLNLRFPRVGKGSLVEFAKVRKALGSEGQRATKKPARNVAKNPAKNLAKTRTKGRKQSKQAG
jgi:hypothetical protein